MHEKRRRYQTPTPVTLEEMAEKLTDSTWTLCTAFTAEGLTLVNDSFGEDGAQEYAVLRQRPDGRYETIESFTVSWMTPERFIAAFKHCQVEPFMVSEPFTLRPHFHPASNGYCPHCA